MSNKRTKCSNCSKRLTKNNSSKSVFKRKRGFCLKCNAQYHSTHYKKNRRAILDARSQVHRKHARIKLLLKKERAPKSDLLWSLNFYTELIRDRECHYCGGALSAMGGDLDAMNNNLGHRCFNVVPCCRACNVRKMHDVQYAEMSEIRPWLIKLRIRKENASPLYK
jgi:hypothetical protein